MDEQQYLNERLENQITWYDKKSKRNKFWYRTLRIMEIVIAPSIPFFAGQMNKENGETVKTVIAVSGVIISIIAGLLGLLKLQEQWIEYRTVCESLRHEKFLYLTKTSPYDVADVSFHLLVERVETLVSKENTDWSKYLKSKSEK